MYSYKRNIEFSKVNLHDAIINSISINDEEVVFIFDDYGFSVWDDDLCDYVGARGAKMRIPRLQSEYDSLEVLLLKKHSFCRKTILPTYKYMSLADLSEKVNAGKHWLEVIYELHSPSTSIVELHGYIDRRTPFTLLIHHDGDVCYEWEGVYSY